MRMLNGWKEIAECLHRTPRSARRWERLGLPVWRLTDSRRSPVIAYEDEIENWVQRRRLRVNGSRDPNTVAFRAARREPDHSSPDWRALREQLEHMRKLGEENRRLRANVTLAKENLWKGVIRSFPKAG